MEAALLAAARFIADKVAILVQLDEKLKSITGIKGKMEKLKELSPIIDAVLQDVESRPFTDDTVKDLLRKLKYLAYNLEDVVDYYDTEALRKQRSSASFKPVRDFFSSNNQVAFKNRISGMIKAVTDNLDSILLQKSILVNLPQNSIRMPESSLRGETHSRTSLVLRGRETEKDMIVDMLTKDDGDESSHDLLKVIAIVGMGGLGKTTLAQLVFNDDRVKAHFASSSRMWKVVGAEFDPAKIMKSVLELATRKPVDISEIDLVRQNLEKALSRKKFLLVLDDVWNENASKWDVLKTALTCGERGSKILVTTRSLLVSSIMGSSSSTTHQIQQLSRDDCLSLFQQSAFGDEVADQKLMEIGGKIVEKCGGVPLAAVSLGSMLHGTRDETYWSSALSSEIWQLRDEEQKVLAVLKWSYDALPLRSKKCFAFASLFSKNYTMEKHELIEQWIANGFVSSERNFDAETVGNRVFDDLVLRSFFLLVPFEDATKCTMHDLMHDLARSVSANVYWNSTQDSVEDIGKRTYHLQIFPGELPDDMFSQVISKKPLCLRSFMSQNTFSLLQIDLLEVFSKLKFLRVLDLRCSNIKKVPASVGNLIHLRYLNLSWNDIEVLPGSITLLHNLQNLYCANLRLTYMPRGFSRLINLRTLPLFFADNRSGACSITELEDLKLHGEMTVIFSKNFTDYSCGGRKLLKNKHLNQLSLHFNCSENNDRDMLDDLCPGTSLKKLSIVNYGSRQFPTWFIDLQSPNLVEVSLKNCRGCEHIPPFGNLQFLKKLDLCIQNDNFTQMGDEFHGHGGFPSLQELILNGMYNLEEWTESHGANQSFPLLQKLRVFRCPKLKCMPEFPRIRELEMSFCSGILLSCVGRLTSLSILKLEEMISMASLPSGCIRNLTSLTKLKITECKQLQHLPGDEMHLLEAIRSLTIYSCNNLASFPSELERLSSLRSLRLTRSSQRITVQPETLIPILNSLHKFRIEICGKKVILRGQLQRLHTLRELLISGKHGTFFFYRKATQLGICCCDELESLMTTEPAASSTSVLEDLYINEISNLTTLPEWLQHLKSLRILSIRNCPLLEKGAEGFKGSASVERFEAYQLPTAGRKMPKGDGRRLAHHFTSAAGYCFSGSSDSAGHNSTGR